MNLNYLLISAKEEERYAHTDAQRAGGKTEGQEKSAAAAGGVHFPA